MLDKRLWNIMFSGKIDQRGWIFVGIGCCISALFFLVHTKLALLCSAVTLMVGLFFRDPTRCTPLKSELIISPADGIILDIVDCTPPSELDLGPGPWARISIFLNLWDVHVNRFPVDGRILQVSYAPGKFLEAFTSESSLENERCGVVIQVAQGFQVACVQIAGWIARRIVCDAKVDQLAKKGEKYGIICFGSRMDLYLPKYQVDIWATPHQRTVAGETILGMIKEEEDAKPFATQEFIPEVKKFNI
ncbi:MULTISPECIES: phosphatidylserine decarboxylase [Holospora]|uniref:Phosphatidylserine decarboxylase proenzyme n=2 Tax=Holospora TaxID=44747 RepID=A0A061JI60_9PROT|nr:MULTISPECIES: phosphatidylserine decarboxylase [Holospora]ETZ05188.1 phosphatidylserine decarboxylase proenzyme [Holospora undulata HU1]GAJ46666.1 phosphatidylserine decarboxylase proenzyme [Holospora elegans E1]